MKFIILCCLLIAGAFTATDFTIGTGTDASDHGTDPNYIWVAGTTVAAC